MSFLEKWWGVGGGEKNNNKIYARENATKKNSCKEEGKEKKFMRKEGPMVTFSESLSFRNQQPGTIWINNFWPWRKHNRTRIKDTPTLLVPFAANGKLVFSILAISI